jgi:hypothetical protein
MTLNTVNSCGQEYIQGKSIVTSSIGSSRKLIGAFKDAT